ncbi:hypothetical protein [Nannocystis sp. SCPEA4]|uniref:hypothetical protein n=1 Tax=Nannocystis sp. SCPEA4 TaxID=2996787 RepID=UPI00226D9883|nr:hypothetical protein [Nannocystis sp. SCPEA4]MCY1062152.1 hypothetical protein [Nannocystis sp. SCPEA4]
MAASRRNLFATELHAPVPEVRFSFEGDTSTLVDPSSVARSDYAVTWTGKPHAQVWLTAKPAFAPSFDVFLGYHALDTATATMAAQLIADALQRELTVDGRAVTPRAPKEFLSRRLFRDEKDYQNTLAKLDQLRS